MYHSGNVLHSVSNCGKKNVVGEHSNDFVNSDLPFNLNCVMNVKVDLPVSQ